MKRHLFIVLLGIFTPVLAASARSGERGASVASCESRGEVVAVLQNAMQKGRIVETQGDMGGSCRIYRQAAQRVIRNYPDCKEIKEYLEDVLEQVDTFGRPSDRAEAWKRSFDTVLQDDGQTPDTDTLRTEPGDEGEEGDMSERLDVGTAGDAGSGSLDWMTDPYFLILELILLAVLFCIREIRRLRHAMQSPPSTVRPARFRTIPKRFLNTRWK